MPLLHEAEDDPRSHKSRSLPLKRIQSKLCKPPEISQPKCYKNKISRMLNEARSMLARGILA